MGSGLTTARRKQSCSEARAQGRARVRVVHAFQPALHAPGANLVVAFVRAAHWQRMDGS